MKKMKRIFTLFLAVVLCISMGACGSTDESSATEAQTETTAEAAETEAAAEGETRTVTDMSGVEVEIPMEVNTYVESWFAHNAVDLMLNQAEGMLVTCANTDTHQWMYIVCPNFYNAVSTTFEADMNLEEIIAADPDVVFGSNDDYREMFNSVGIPFINCSFKTYDQMIQSIQLTAEVFGGDAVEKAQKYVDYLNERLAWVAKRTDTIPEEERVRVAHGSSVYELDFDGANTIIDEWINLSGGINAAAEEVEGNLQVINLEQVLAWDPDVIITGRPQEQVDEIMSDPAWAQLSAVKNGKVYSNPRGVFAWDRYGVEAALQPQWCAQLLYPELFEDFDIKEEVKHFYQEFFDYSLSDEQAQMILDYVTPDLENPPAAAEETTEEAIPESGEWTFTDQADNEVTVTLPIERMVVLQHHSIDIICQLGGQDKVVGVEDNWEKDLGSYIADIWPEIGTMPTCGSLAEPNVEAVAALEPDVVIVASQADEAICSQLRDLGIPVCTVSLRGEGKQAEAQNPRLSDADKAYTDGCEWAVKTLGALTGRSEQAEELWAFCEESRAMVDEAVGDISDEERTTAIAVFNNNSVYGNDKYVGCMLLRAGGINAAAADIQGNGEYSAENLAAWDPDYIITQDRYPEVYEELTTAPEYAEIRAVKEGHVILAPYWTKPWGNPDADSMALGELWLAHTFYPDKVSEETVLERAQQFYEKFYGVEFQGSMTVELDEAA